MDLTDLLGAYRSPVLDQGALPASGNVRVPLCTRPGDRTLFLAERLQLLLGDVRRTLSVNAGTP